jgi:mannose-6-phosphate isomerase-like protein (cupin superfamily)
VDVNDRIIFQLGPGEGRSLWVLGGLVTRKVSSERTGGAYSLFEVTARPQEGAPPHIQHREDECFYVLEGDFEFLDDVRAFVTGPGSLIYGPKGNLHAFENVGEDTGRMLVSQTPGGLHERFFEELGEEARERTIPPVPDGTPNVGKIIAIAAKYGIEIPLPPDQ